MSSDSPERYKLSRLLKRKVAFSPLNNEHLPYIWYAYRKGLLGVLHPVFEGTLSQEEFLSAFAGYLQANNLSAVVFFSEVSGKVKLVGFGTFWVRGRVIQTENLIWMDYASQRNILEAAINFLNEMRRTTHPDTGRKYVVLEFAEEQHEAFFNTICKYGVMRRAGTYHELYEGKACAYETRSV